MNLINEYPLSCRKALFLAMGLLANVACTSNPALQASGGSGSTSGHIDILCIGDRIEKPTEDFHYTYKYTGEPRDRDDAADVTPQSIDVTYEDGSGKGRHDHALRSDQAGWDRAVLDLSHLNFTAMTGRLEPLQGTSAIVKQGSETVNGYGTTKYAIDTSRASSADQRRIETLLGNGSFERGTAWIAEDGCVAKLVLDEGVARNGTVEKDHFEVNRSKR